MYLKCHVKQTVTLYGRHVKDHFLHIVYLYAKALLNHLVFDVAVLVQLRPIHRWRAEVTVEGLHGSLV